MFFGLGPTFSYKYIYISSDFNAFCDPLAMFFMFPTHSRILVMDRVYQSCVVTFAGHETRVDLIILDMVDYDVILSMNWLAS